MIDRIHGGNCLKKDIIDFSVNINPLGLSDKLSCIIPKNTGLILRYPDPSSERLKIKLAESHGIDAKNIAIGNGSIELIYLIPRAFKLKKPLIVIPTFSEYEFSLKANGSRPSFFRTREQDNFRIDLGKLAGGVARSDAVFICNPNNPTGSKLRDDELSRLIRLCRKYGTIMVLDEAFIDFSEGPLRTAVVPEAVRDGHMVIIRSLTKFFAMPGLRLGYAVGHESVIGKISGLQYPWNVNHPAQLAGEEVLADKIYADRTRQFIAKERQYMFKALGAIKGLRTYPSSANFILCKLQNTAIKDSNELAGLLLRKGMYIRVCGNFRGLDDRFFRVAVRRRGDNDRLIDGIRRLLR
jgi:threonine-phosphate decarboxylase